MERSLDKLKPGEKGTIINIKGTGAVKRRLIDMGVTKGIEIFVRKVAPFGDPIEVNIRGYELTFRRAEAQTITVR